MDLLDGDQSNLSLYFQIPQYISLAFSQVFGLLASLEFAYFIAPSSAKSLFMSLYYFSRILAQYIVDGYMTYLSTTSSKLDFSVSMKIEYYLSIFNEYF